MPSKAVEIKRHGKHYTPPELAGFLAERVVAHLCPPGDKVVVLDPACGDGELLLAMHDAVSRRFPGVKITLEGCDLDPAAIGRARSRAVRRGIDIAWQAGDFFQIGRSLPPGSFHAVIMNPPYVRTQQLGQAAARMLAEEYGLNGRVDLTHPFVRRCPALLRAGGVLGLLCSNRFLTTRAGANVRDVFRHQMQPVELYDLGDTRLFTAAVLPAIIIARNQSVTSSTPCSFTSAYEGAVGGSDLVSSLYDALRGGQDCVARHEGRAIAVKTGLLAHGVSVTDPWRISRTDGDAWLEKIRSATWQTFGDVAKVRVGIKTTADSVFISNDWETQPHGPEPEVLLPLITHHDVAPWVISSRPAARVLYPYDLTKSRRTLVDMTKLPRAMAYLESHGERLKRRKYVVESGRAWYEIWVPQRPSMWASPKIVFPDISENARFAYDTSGAVVNGDCYWISLDDIGSEDVVHLMLAVANSELGRRFYDEVCGNRLYSGRRRWITQYVEKLPLPDPRADGARAVIHFVKQILDAGEPPSEGDLGALNLLVETAFSARSR